MNEMLTQTTYWIETISDGYCGVDTSSTPQQHNEKKYKHISSPIGEVLCQLSDHLLKPDFVMLLIGALCLKNVKYITLKFRLISWFFIKD